MKQCPRCGTVKTFMGDVCEECEPQSKQWSPIKYEGSVARDRGFPMNRKLEVFGNRAFKIPPKFDRDLLAIGCRIKDVYSANFSKRGQWRALARPEAMRRFAEARDQIIRICEELYQKHKGPFTMDDLKAHPQAPAAHYCQRIVSGITHPLGIKVGQALGWQIGRDAPGYAVYQVLANFHFACHTQPKERVLANFRYVLESENWFPKKVVDYRASKEAAPVADYRAARVSPPVKAEKKRYNYANNDAKYAEVLAAIYTLDKTGHGVRGIDIAKHLGWSSGTVSHYVQRGRNEGYIDNLNPVDVGSPAQYVLTNPHEAKDVTPETEPAVHAVKPDELEQAIHNSGGLTINNLIIVSSDDLPVLIEKLSKIKVG